MAANKGNIIITERKPYGTLVERTTIESTLRKVGSIALISTQTPTNKIGEQTPKGRNTTKK